MRATASGAGNKPLYVVGYISVSTAGRNLEGLWGPLVEQALHALLKEMSTAEQARALNDGLIGAGFVRPPVGGEGDYLGVRVVLEEPLVAALPASHRLAVDEDVRLGDLAEEPFVLYPRRLGLSFYDLVVGACRGTGFEPRVSQEAAHMQTVVGLVAAGAGVSLVPASVAKRGGDGVAYRPLQDEAPSAKIALAWRLGNPSHTV